MRLNAELAVFGRALPYGRKSDSRKGAAVENFRRSKTKKFSGTARVTREETSLTQRAAARRRKLHLKASASMRKLTRSVASPLPKKRSLFGDPTVWHTKLN